MPPVETRRRRHDTSTKFMIHELQKKIAQYVEETYPMYKATWNNTISETAPIRYELTITGKNRKYAGITITQRLVDDLMQMHGIDICEEMKRFIDDEVRIRISD